MRAIKQKLDQDGGLGNTGIATYDFIFSQRPLSAR